MQKKSGSIEKTNKQGKSRFASLLLISLLGLAFFASSINSAPFAYAQTGWTITMQFQGLWSKSDSGWQVTASVSGSATWYLTVTDDQISGSGSGTYNQSPMSGTLHVEGASGTVTAPGFQASETDSVSGTVDSDNTALLEVSATTTNAPASISGTATMTSEGKTVTEPFNIQVTYYSGGGFQVKLQDGYSTTVPVSTNGIQGQTVLTVTEGSSSPTPTWHAPYLTSLPESMDNSYIQNQGDYPTNKMGETAKTIKNVGCKITCAAMILSFYHNLKDVGKMTITPSALNDWLNDNKGYGLKDGKMTAMVSMPKVQEYAKDTLGITLTRDPMRWYSKGSTQYIADMEPFLMKNEPVLLELTHNTKDTHWVVVTGKNGQNDYSILDPGYGQTSLNALKERLGVGTKVTKMDTLYPKNANDVLPGSTIDLGTSLGSITLAGHSPIELCLTDPSGAETGLNPTSNDTICQIPNSSYYQDALPSVSFDDTPLVPTAEIITPMNGTYTLTVIGTGSGSYVVDLLIYDRFGNAHTEQITGTAAPGSIQTYSFDYTDANSALTSTTPTPLPANSAGTLPLYVVAVAAIVVAVIVGTLVFLRKRPKSERLQPMPPPPPPPPPPA